MVRLKQVVLIFLGLIAIAGITISISREQINSGRVIIVSGISSSGKSSAALALRELFANQNIPYLLINLDTFLEGFSKPWINFDPATHNPKTMNPDGLIFRETTVDNHSVISEEIGQLIIKAFTGLCASLKSYSSRGVNVIFEGAFGTFALDILKKNLKNMPIKYIGITVSLEQAEKREIERVGFRGLARGQYNQMQQNINQFDYIVNTTTISPQEAAQKIYDYLLHTS